ncbi:MAG: hypothetical protein IMX04_00840 [Candidatus Carbobacillus altaicus]|uniref:DUF948 domain-containing protein n=1 Tax=Candidatus Carbonibacillus altaicus TaxID=2163959 RepID=A0A2R6XZC3_9BACL|nr:hypothetical protein [Candidatus Carbobacillus altaicus]PTQ55769.1 MAG: hypothetical protein BSOLF_1484 [Candidatus Carbobacillus altaicus]
MWFEIIVAIAAMVVALSFFIGVLALRRFLQSTEKELARTQADLERLVQELSQTLAKTRESLVQLTSDVHVLAEQARGTLAQTEQLTAEVADRSREIQPLTLSLRRAGENLLEMIQLLTQLTLKQQGKIAKVVTVASTGWDLLNKVRRRRKKVDPGKTTGSGPLP